VTPSSSATRAPTSSRTHELRLKKLEIPTFDRNLLDWTSFRKLFTSTVYSSKTLSKAQNLAHLKSLLSGEAFHQVQSLMLSDANYDIAWTLLNDRYQNDREMLFAILRRFHGLPGLQTKSATAIRHLIDTTK
jgi:hypothetical protein